MTQGLIKSSPWQRVTSTALSVLSIFRCRGPPMLIRLLNDQSTWEERTWITSQNIYGLMADSVK